MQPMRGCTSSKLSLTVYYSHPQRSSPVVKAAAFGLHPTVVELDKHSRLSFRAPCICHRTDTHGHTIASASDMAHMLEGGRCDDARERREPRRVHLRVNYPS